MDEYKIDLINSDRIASVLDWCNDRELRGVETSSYFTPSIMTALYTCVPIKEYARKKHGDPIAISLSCTIKIDELWFLVRYLRDSGNPRLSILADSIVNDLPVVCYDNGGKTADRYTIIFTDEPVSPEYDDTWVCALSSRNPFYPQGIYTHGEIQCDPESCLDFLGVNVNLSDLPSNVQRAVIQDLCQD